MDLWELGARESIRQTLSDYTIGTDRAGLEQLTRCFLPQGSLQVGSEEPLVGAEAIIAGLQAVVVPNSSPVPLTHVRHHVASVTFGELSPQRAEVSSYFTVFTDIGVDHWGRYSDVLQPAQDGRWLFASRRIRIDGFAEGSLMRPDA